MKQFIVFARRITRNIHEEREQRLALALSRSMESKQDNSGSREALNSPRWIWASPGETEKIAA